MRKTTHKKKMPDIIWAALKEIIVPRLIKKQKTFSVLMSTVTFVFFFHRSHLTSDKANTKKGNI